MLKLNKEILSKNKSTYSIFPENVDELKTIILEEMSKNGIHCSLNHIDVSNITDMSYLFSKSALLQYFDGDISEWDVSNVRNMTSMFEESKFTGNYGSLKNWDISNVNNFVHMFKESRFNSDLSKWSINCCESNISGMFYMCKIFKQYKPNFLVKN